jgi:hypothetical protein
MYPNLFSRLEEGKPDSKFLSQSGRGTLGVDAQRLLWYWATKLGCTQSKGALNEEEFEKKLRHLSVGSGFDIDVISDCKTADQRTTSTLTKRVSNDQSGKRSI